MVISLRWISILVLFPALILAETQQIVTLDSAITLFKQHSLQRELVQLEQQRRRGEALHFRSVQNPAISIQRENLMQGSVDYSETTYGISQTISILGQSVLRFQSTSREIQAARYQFQYDERRLIHQVQSLYARIWNYSRQIEAYERALEIIRLARESAQARATAGSYSNLQVQRFTIELLKYQDELDTLQTALERHRTQLSGIIFPNPESNDAWHVSNELPTEHVDIELSELEDHALQFRPDILALEEQSVSSALQLQVAKRNILPDFTLNIGFKEQSDGAEGFVFGGSVPLPLFNHNRGNIVMARAEHRSDQTALALKKQQVRNHVKLAYHRAERILDRLRTIQTSEISASMLDVGHTAYEEGRFSLLELLDITRAYLDGQILRFQTVTEYNQALYTLDLVSASRISNPQTVQIP